MREVKEIVSDFVFNSFLICLPLNTSGLEAEVLNLWTQSQHSCVHCLVDRMTADPPQEPLQLPGSSSGT